MRLSLLKLTSYLEQTSTCKYADFPLLSVKNGVYALISRYCHIIRMYIRLLVFCTCDWIPAWVLRLKILHK
jgi:hypothetical protein